VEGDGKRKKVAGKGRGEKSGGKTRGRWEEIVQF